LGELKCWLDIHFHNGRQAGERGGLKLLVFRTANVVDNAEDVATLRKSRSEFVRPFWITEIGSHELTRKIRRRVSRHADEFLVGAASTPDAAPPIPFDGSLMTIDRVITRSADSKQTSFAVRRARS
jgi:hypothetical protein